MDWAADQVERRTTGTLTPYADNPRVHTPEQVTRIAHSMQRFGVTMPILIGEDGMIIAGHGRVLAARQLGYAELPVLVARGWSEADKRAYRIADNRLTELSTWDERLLGLELQALRELGFDDGNLGIIGFSEQELAQYMGDKDSLGELDNPSTLLELVNVTMGDPRHQVAVGDHFTLRGTLDPSNSSAQPRLHHLFCESVVSGWPRWGPTLWGPLQGTSEQSSRSTMAAPPPGMTADRLFCPYPGVFVPFAKKAAICDLVMVQPDPYIAGHMLDRYDEVNPGSIEKK